MYFAYVLISAKSPGGKNLLLPSVEVKQPWLLASPLQYCKVCLSACVECLCIQFLPP